MYRWNSRVPTVRWKDNCLSDSRGSSGGVTTEGTVDTTASLSKTNNIINSSDISNTNGSRSSTGISCSSSGGASNLSGSTLTSTDPITLLEKHAIVTPEVNGAFSSKSTENPLCIFDTPEKTLATNKLQLHQPSPLLLSSEIGSLETTGNKQQIPTVASDDKTFLDESTYHSAEHWNWNVITTFVSFVGIVVREIRTLSIALLIRLLVNPINYCICCFSPSPISSQRTSQPFFSSIRRLVPGGSSSTSYYYCCKRRNIIKGSNSVFAAFPSFIRLPCCCTCNCISLLRPILGGGVGCGFGAECCSSKGTYNSSSCGTSSTTHHSCISRQTGVGKPGRGLGKMAQILSKTMTLLGVAFVIHFIIMSTFAEKEGLIPQPRFSRSADGSTKYHYHHHYHDDYDTDGMGEMGAVRMNKRLARSYRHEKHPTPVPAASSDANVLSSLTGHHSSRLLSSNKSEAVFSTENSTVIIAQIGSKTYLPCAVRNLGSGVASWIRRRDYHLLTVGMGTYSNDDRFMVSHNRPAQSWELHIKFVKPSDEGIYECQISTHPPSSIFVHLRVVEAKAEILGEPDKHVRSGSTFELVCVLRDSTEPPVYVFWYHNDRMINYDNVRGVQVSSDAEKSILTIQEAQKSDSGNYTCVPSNARPTSISVHILNGEKPAAMQHGSRSHSSRLVPSCSGPLLLVTGLVVFLLTTWLATTNQSQQNLLYFEQHEPFPDDHQNKQEHEEHRQEQRQKRQRKVLTAAEHKPEKNHWQTNYHQFYLQLLTKISEKFGKVVDNGSGSDDENKRNSPHTITTTGEEAHFDNIKNDTHSVTKILCILFLLEVNRRAVEISCKSNLKKPQAKSCLDGFPSTNSVTTTATATGSSRKAAIIKSSSNPAPSSATAAIHHFHHHHPYSVLGKYSSLKNNAYEHCVPRQVVSVGKKENETMLGGGRSAVAQVAPSVDDIIKVDQYHHHQDHVHASLVSGDVGKDIEEKRIVTLMISTLNKRRHAKDTIKTNKERIYYHSRKWDSQQKVGPEWVDDYNDTAFKPKFCGSFQHQRRNFCVLEKMKGKVGENFANEFPSNAKALEYDVAPGVAAVQRVTGSKSRRLSMVTTFSSSSEEISVSPVSSESFVLSPCTSSKVTYPMAYKRFITAITANNPPTVTRSPLLSPEKKGNFKVETLVFCIVTPVQVIIVVLTIIIIRKEVDSSLHRHHHHQHFTVLFPSACFYYYNSLTTTTSGLLVSCFHFLLISSSSTFLPALVATAPRLIPTSTTSFQPLFCLKNKAEEDGDCLPQLLVKRLVLQQPKTPPSSSQPPEYYSVTVPTTNNNNSNNHTYKLPNTLDFTMKQTGVVAVR